MNKRTSYIILLFVALLCAMQSLAQSTAPDVVCMGTSKNYYVTPTPASRYIWKINDGNPEASTSNSIDINWTKTGVYTLTVQEITSNNCIGMERSLQVTVVATSASTTEKRSICESELPFSWHNISINSSGTYSDTLRNSLGCDSIILLELSIIPTTTSVTEHAVCPLSLPFQWNGLSISEAGTYSAKLTNANACDSIAVLNLHIESPLRSTTNINMCSSELPYYWNNSYYYESGTYTADFLNKDRCDSIATLNLKVSYPTSSHTIATICEGETYYFNAEKYTTEGHYNVLLSNTNGCDSTANLTLNVIKHSTSITEVEVKLSGLPYKWNGSAYYYPGEHISEKEFKNCLGCDSIPKLILKVDAPTSSVTNATICEGENYYFDNKSYSIAGTYSVHKTNTMGSDSTATLNLTVHPTYTISQTIQIFSGESYTVAGHTYNTDGTYTDVQKTQFGCDSTIITKLTIIDIPNTITPNGDGTNDLFMKDFHIQIYNRNGVLLYEGMEGWNGIYNNKAVSKDTYFYVIYYTWDNEMKHKEGYITVLH